MFNKEIKIGNKLISENNSSYVIAEIGANFNGSLSKAKQLCLAAKKAGADCAKFQTFKSSKIVSAKGFSKMNLKGVHGTWDKSISEVFKEVEFPREWHKEVKNYCDEINIDFSTSPYDFDAVDLCKKMELPFIKIGSGEITWLEMIEYVAKKLHHTPSICKSNYIDPKLLEKYERNPEKFCEYFKGNVNKRFTAHLSENY